MHDYPPMIQRNSRLQLAVFGSLLVLGTSAYAATDVRVVTPPPPEVEAPVVQPGTDPAGSVSNRATDPTTGQPNVPFGAQPQAQPVEAFPADNPMTDFAAWAVGFSWLVGVLVTLLLGSAFLVLNLGLLSKRPEDHVGGRTPSDVGILKDQLWPQEPRERRVLPAEEDEEGDLREAIGSEIHRQPDYPRQQDSPPPYEPKPFKRAG